MIAGCLVGIHCLPPYWKISYVAIPLRMLLSEHRWPMNCIHTSPLSHSLSLIRMKKHLSHVITWLRIHHHIFCQNKSSTQQLVFTAQFFRNLPQNLMSNTVEPRLRVWKGNFGIRTLTKIRYGIRENAKYIGGKRDVCATQEAGFTKIWAQDEGFFRCVSEIREIMTTQIHALAANAIQQG